MNETVDASGEKPGASTVSVHKDVFSYERLVATSVMEAAAFSLSIDHLRRERFHTGVLPESCQLPLIRCHPGTQKRVPASRRGPFPVSYGRSQSAYRMLMDVCLGNCFLAAFGTEMVRIPSSNLADTSSGSTSSPT